MKTLIKFTLVASLINFMGCADFPEKYENVVDGEKIRPFAIVLNPPEAAPGDTVSVSLRMYDAGKNYDIEWELGLKYQVDNYDNFQSASRILDLESGNMKINESEDGLEFSFVVPTEDKNPLVLSDMIPDVIREESELTSEEKSELESLGITNLSSGLKREDLLKLLDKASSLPNDFSPLVDNFVALIQLKAKVTSPRFELDVIKNLTVRYSNKLEKGNFISNVNINPNIDSIGIIRVHSSGITDIKDIKNHTSDTVFFTTTTDNNDSSPEYDTLNARDDYSYFVIAASVGSEQSYRSPKEKVHKEEIYYQWFYTNIDDTNTGWEDLITLNIDDSPGDLPVVALTIPKNKDMHHFTLRATAIDWRVEWGALTSRGLDHKVIYGYFNFQ